MTKSKAMCSSGHYYNADRFDLCPICGARAVSEVKSLIPGLQIELWLPRPQALNRRLHLKMI